MELKIVFLCFYLLSVGWAYTVMSIYKNKGHEHSELLHVLIALFWPIFALISFLMEVI